MSEPEYLSVNRANWDDRAGLHVAADYGMEHLLSAPDALSAVVRFDRPRLGDLAGLDVVHLQCHIGTDTISLARLGAASVTGVDFSGVALAHAADLAARAGASVEYVESDVYNAPAALGGRTFDLVYTGIGALGWLPDIRRWATTVAELLRPGGRLFIREGHPIYNAIVPVVVASVDEFWSEYADVVRPGRRALALELPYFERAAPMIWHDEGTYGGPGQVTHTETWEWNRGIGEIVTAVLDAGLQLTGLVEHDSVPWSFLGDDMTLDEATGEYRLAERPDRLPATFTLTAVKPD